MFEVNVKYVTEEEEGRRGGGGLAWVWGFDSAHRTDKPQLFLLLCSRILRPRVLGNDILVLKLIVKNIYKSRGTLS